MLASIIGTKKAAELVLLCENITALELQSFGLVNKVVDGEAALDEATLSFASKIVRLPVHRQDGRGIEEGRGGREW